MRNLKTGSENLGTYKELIRKYDKVRDFTRDFYIYGFKSRNDFNHKSSRTYDNEKRRIESIMGDYLKFNYTTTGKKQFITLNCENLPTNPLYATWKAKSFTDKDIILHFYILSTLNKNKLSIEDLTNTICENSGMLFDTQTIRNKCKEYIDEGLLFAEKQGKTLYYSNTDKYFENIYTLAPNIVDAIKFYQGDTLFGEIGNFLCDTNNIENDRFLFKHYYMVNTLDDGILLDILYAIKNHKTIEFENSNEEKTLSSVFRCVPIKIFISLSTGRRYLCSYNLKNNRFYNFRLDHIKTIKILNTHNETDMIKNNLDKNISKVWSVGFEGKHREESISFKLFINEKYESYVIDRIHREGRNGTLSKLEENIFLYTVTLFDTNDISPWLKTFMGRILEVTGTNDAVINRFYKDIKKMKEMYDE